MGVVERERCVREHALNKWSLVCLLACASACGADDMAARGGKPTGAAPPLTGACMHRNLTQPCSCDMQSGRQTCIDGTWSSCECSGGDGAAGSGGSGNVPSFEGNLRTDITFVWEHTPASTGDGSCLPGTYEGNFSGGYYSALSGPPSGMPLVVPVANLDLPDQPSGFFFTVEPAEGGETIQKVKGQMNGTADLTFPFVAMIEGELDCASATFTARLIDGHYSVLAEGLLPQYFDGVMSGHYDKRTHTFVDGVWDVRETSAMPPGTLAPTLPRDPKRDGYGGEGIWATSLPTDLSNPALTPCPMNYTCDGGPLGPNKLLCNGLLGPPPCTTDADCNTLFPNEGVLCLKASALSLCVRECKP